MFIYLNMKQQVTLFEILPNEILSECLKYLNAVDLLRSFHNVKKHEFNEFCSRISSCANIKNQIHLFLNLFALTDFVHPSYLR